MALIKVTDHYKYKITKLELIVPGKDPIELKTLNIINFSIEKDFDEDHFPILYFKLRLEPDIYYEDVVANKTDVKIRVRMDMYMYDENSTLKATQLVFNELFAIYIDDNNKMYDKKMYELQKEIEQTDHPMSSFAEPYDFFLFKDSDLSASKGLINTVITAGNMTDISTYMLSASGSTKILMSPMNNNATHTEVILPPLSVIQRLDYLEKQYGMYDHGMMLFYDFERTYMIDKNVECTAWETGEYKDVVIEIFKTSSMHAITPGCFKDEDNKCYIIHAPKDCYTANTNSVINDQLSGNNMIVVDAGKGNVTNVKPDVQQRGSGTQKVYIDRFDNKYTKKSMEYRAIENDNIVTMNLNNIDITALTPNKRFKLVFEDTEVQKKTGGFYRLSRMVCIFEKHGEDYLMSVSTIFKGKK